MGYLEHKQRKKNQNMVGKLIVTLQLLLSAFMIGLLWNSNLVPIKYVAVVAITLILLFAIFFVMQYKKNKNHIVITIISVFISIVLCVGILFLNQTSNAVKNISGAAYKTDNMIVVVKKGDKAETLLDTPYYLYGIQTTADQENTATMLNEVNQILGRAVHVTEYRNVVEMAEAMLNGSISAAIYNEAFSEFIEEQVPDYGSQVRVLYHYGIETELETVDASVQEPFNVYISGIDVSGPISTNSRSDVNIIATVNPKTKQILLTTTPRDYYVQIPGISGEQSDKLTHAGIYGVDASIATLEQLYGISIPYYVRVNFTSLIQIVDILGGIEVESDVAFTSLHGNYDFVQGINYMNGEQALGFVRERYSFVDGDNQRGKNQEKVLTAIIEKAMSPAILLKASDMIAAVSDSFETNMSSDKITDLIQMQLNDGSSWEITSVNATGLGDQQICFSSGDEILYVMRPDYASVDEIKRKMNIVFENQ